MRRVSSCSAIPLFLLLFILPSAAQSVRNPSFEDIQIGYPYYSSNASDIPFWTHSGDHGDNWIWRVGADHVSVAGDGLEFITLGGGINAPGNASWTTRVIGLHAGTYVLRFKIANEGQPASQSITATLSNGATGTGTFSTSTGSGPLYWTSWEQKTLVFTAAAGPVATLTFSVTNQQYDIGLDDITVTRVPDTGGTWTPLTHQPTFHPGASLLLTDGTVLVHEESDMLSDGANYSNWYRLTPDSSGSYTNGTWSTVPSKLPSGYGPIFFASAVLIDGRAIVEGGEYNNFVQVWTNLGAIFDNNPNSPGFNTWSAVAPPIGWAYIGDAQSVVLPDGTYMLANAITRDEAEMPPPYLGGSSWISTGTLKHDRNDEEGWTLLPGPPDAEILLTTDTYADTNNCLPSSNTWSEIYINGTWFCYGQTVAQLWDTASREIGPAVLRPDGTVFQAGGVPKSGIFDSNTFTWRAGPNFPGGNDIADGPAALLPSGNILMIASPGVFTKPATFYTLQYQTDNLVQEPTSPPDSPTRNSEQGHMLVLPTGQIFLTDFTKDIEIYTPNDRNVNPLWKPRLPQCSHSIFGYQYSAPCPVTVHNTSTNILYGWQFNGLSQGAGYGDDYQSATNYPLVRLIDTTCFLCGPPPVYYCRTHNHSSMGVATGSQRVSTEFDCPNVPAGYFYQLEVVTNGIPSDRAFANVVP